MQPETVFKMWILSLTTREIGRLLKQCNIDFASLPDEEFDPAMGVSTGAGAIFGATGGVMEAALRTAARYDFWRTFGRHRVPLKYAAHKIIKRQLINLNGLEVKVAVVSGLENANTLLEKSTLRRSAFVSLLRLCVVLGGCVNGGGTCLPYTTGRST